MIIYIMNYLTLNSQQKVKNYTKNVIDEIGICDDIKNKYPQHYNYFTTFLFPRHPAYPERFIDMVNAGIKNNDVFTKYKEVYLIKKNNEIDIISVMNKCVTGKNSDNLTKAMRYSIVDQIVGYRNMQDKRVCVKCGSTDDIQVDHHKLLFIELKNNFINQYVNNVSSESLTLPIEFDSNDFNGKVFKSSDKNFEDKWNEYHKNNATLRLLCQKCNLSRNKKK